MSSKQSRFPSAPARIEMLESRRLLCASPTSHVTAAHVVTQAVHVKPAIPNIAGAVFTGTVRAAGESIGLTISFDSETTKGALSATVTSAAIFPCTGTVKNTRAVSMKGKESTLSLTLTGKLSATLDTLIGKFTLKGKKTIRGSYTVTRTV